MRKKKNDISADELLRQLKAEVNFDDIELSEDIKIPDVHDIPPAEQEEKADKKLSKRERRKAQKAAKAAKNSKDDPRACVKDVFVEGEANPLDSDMNLTGELKAIPMPSLKTEKEAEAVSEEKVQEQTSAEVFEAADDDVIVAPDIMAAATGEVELVKSDDDVRISTKEFDAVAAVKEDKPSDTAEFDITSDDDISDVDVDTLMRKYLSEAEYNEVLRTRSKDIPEIDLALGRSEAEEYVSAIEEQIEKTESTLPATETQKVLAEMDLSEVGNDEFDETDVNLMIAFGMNEELKEKLGEENVQMVKEALDKDAETFGNVKRESFVPDEIDRNMEFTHSFQIKEVFNIYKKKYRNILIKLYISIFALIAIFIFENFTALGGSFPVWLDPQVFPVIHSMVSLQLLLLACLPVLKQIIWGFGSLFTFRPTSNSILSVLVLLSVAYHTSVCFLYDGSEMVLCNTPIVLFIIINIISQLLTLKRDIYSFNIVSSKRVKYVVSKIPEEEVVMEHEVFDEYIDEDSAIFRVSKTSFVDGFFRRTREYTKGKTVLGVIIPLCLIISAFFLVYHGVFRHDWYQGVRNAYIALLISTPLSVFMTFSYPMYRAAKVAFENGSAIVGESSLEEYANSGAVSFDDKDVFPSAKTKVRSIKIYGNNRIDRVIYNIASLFKVLGGPLCDVFNIATKDFECSDDVEIMDISQDGIEAVISGKHIFYGKASYLHKNNFEPVYEEDDQRIELSGEACISYLVCNDEVAAKVYVHYGIDPDFIAISKQLFHAGMCIGIKSFDPNIDDSLLGRYINLSKYAVKVLKCRYLSDKTTTEERSDSGIVSKKSPKSLLKTLALCDKVNSVTKLSMFVKAMAILLAFGISIFTLMKGSGFGDFGGLYIAAYQLFWMIPILGISLINIKK